MTAFSATEAVTALGSLAQDHRLAVFRLLVQAGDAGMAAGEIAERLDIPNSAPCLSISPISNDRAWSAGRATGAPSSMARTMPR